MKQRLAQSDEPPVSVRAALAFVNLCNEFMEPKPVCVEHPDGNGQTFDIVVRDLPCMQEKAFNLACIRIGNYFSQETPKAPAKRAAKPRKS